MKNILKGFKKLSVCIVAAAGVLAVNLSASAIETDDWGYRYTISYDVKTPKGTAVKTVQFIDELTPNMRDLLIAFQQENYPNVYVVRHPTIHYNCHSYAWYSSDPSNNHWMEDPSAYINDGSAELIAMTIDFSTIPNSVKNNTKAVWLRKDGTYEHSGAVWTSDKLMSKWGRMGLYAHKQDYTPYDEKWVIQYWV